MNADREHRIRGSLERHVGRTATDNETLRELAAIAFRQRRAVVFLPEHLEAMPAMVRALIEGEARRIYGSRQPAKPGNA
jgi:hypothetical protein